MSSPPVIAITAKQRKLLADDMEYYQPEVLERGALLYAQNAVRRVFWSDPGTSLQAEVQGSKLYTVTLDFERFGLDTFCTCPQATECKHTAALLLHLRAKAVVVAATKTKAPKAAKTVVAQPGKDSFAGRVASQSGNTLSASAVKFLQQAEVWWVNRQSLIAQVDLFKLCGRQSYWGYGQVQLWPPELPPADETEFFAYLGHAMGKCQLQLPAGLEPAVDRTVQQRLLQRWERLKQIEDWRKRLGNWQEPQLHLAPEAPELRLMLHQLGATVQVRHPGEAEFGKTTQKLLKQLWGGSTNSGNSPQNLLSAGSNLVLKAALVHYGDLRPADIPPLSDSLAKSLAQLITSESLFQTHVVTSTGESLLTHDEALRWDLQPPATPGGDYALRLLDDDGRSPSPPLAILPGFPLRYVTHEVVHAVNYWPFGKDSMKWPVFIPAAALETKEGVSALAKLGVPVPLPLEGRVKIIRAEIEVRCKLHRYQHANSDYLQVRTLAKFGGMQNPSLWTGTNWAAINRSAPAEKPAPDEIVQLDKSHLSAAGAWLAQWPLKPVYSAIHDQWLEQRIQGKDWPDQFLAWLDRRPKGLVVELDAELASLREGRVSGSVRLDIEESKAGIDWFDLSVALDVTDSTLTQEEIDLLLKAKGKWVRLAGKGWRKLEFTLSEEQLKELAELGLATNDFSPEKQRLHALQLGGLAKKNTTLLSAERIEQVRRRVEEIQTRVTPAAPKAITATMRPYQLEGFHFLAYLTTNCFGGVLADDMGLGKTLQALTWIAWLRGEKKVRDPMLVICPKSVQDNWRSEAEKFFPKLKVEVWSRATAGKTGLSGKTDLLVIHYAQLRLHEELLCKETWSAVILDEAQAIKNPTSQNSRAACALSAPYRLALTGTPIENRLLDLWAIFAFAMPGVLGNRSSFTKNFDGKDDPLARRRLAARTRPFLLRRTKNEVAKDLPDRIEEDLIIEFEGTQAALYQAELKRARAQLLKAETSKQLDKLRFNILTSLLRLRQICCHPRLLGLEASAKKKSDEKTDESAKVAALMELLEPLIEEGQKVLVFSQFVEMLEIIEAEIQERGWHTFKLTGKTEDRGALVQSFQSHAGAATFLISLKAGGFGLNLTAASYVVLFDPWWNPAVEAQAIDRTHRIGQKQTVFAYRLLIKGTIEEKIRVLQKQKGAIANDILGEENFASALTLDDFQFLLGEE
ncbi:MAG: SNF2-related protein [Prosthecobacter sp.]|uniref:DEAD/DEAH box helicase n=1 Tax=Prosthecobacter sp. TaxID=1965333 RepID=UPI0038FE70B0